jgi:predicted CoA-binding protein
VQRIYDKFEKMPDGSMLWRQTVTGHEEAIRVSKELSAKTVNEVCVMHLATKSVVATMNTPQS